MTERVRVLQLIKGLGPGGAEQLVLQQARKRDRARFDYRAAYVVPGKSHLVEQLEREDVDVTCLGRGGRLGAATWPWRLRQLLSAGRFDVVHVHSPLLAAGCRVLARTVRHRPRVITTEHNRWPRHKRPTRWANRATLALDDATVAVSTDVARSMPQRHRSTIDVLVHGIDLDAVHAVSDERAAVRAELGIDDEQLVVGIVANLRPEKGYDVLLRAAALVIAERPDVVFVSVGQGPLADEIAEQHDHLALGDGFRLLGYRADATRVMAGFDVFTMASRHEGLPVALMDALALGLPVVATTAGGIPQAVRNETQAVLVPPDDERALAEAIIRVARDDSLRARLGAAAAERADAFDVDRTTDWLESRYVDVLAGAR